MGDAHGIDEAIKAAHRLAREKKYPDNPGLHVPVEPLEAEACWRPDGSSVTVVVSSMYDLDGLSEFDIMSTLAEFFGSREINVGESSYTPGCETCDYGSEASRSYTVLSPTKGKEK